jgi:hypothetical protein
MVFLGSRGRVIVAPCRFSSLAPRCAPALSAPASGKKQQKISANPFYSTRAPDLASSSAPTQAHCDPEKRPSLLDEGGKEK